MLSFTLDTNCLIDLEENREDSKYLVDMIDHWKKGKINISVVAVSASENQKAGESNKNYAEFESKLGNIGLAENGDSIFFSCIARVLSLSFRDGTHGKDSYSGDSASCNTARSSQK